MKFRMAMFLAVAFGLIVPSGASAAHHLVKVSEVYVDTADTNKAFVELQMYAAGQNQVNGDTISLFDSAGNPSGSPTLTSNVPNSASQRSILISTPEFAASSGVTPDFNNLIGGEIDPVGGAACFASFDCATWGSFSSFGALSSPDEATGPTFAAGMSLTRSIAPGCSTLLESGDDTNNSSVDFSSKAPTPRNNATTPTEMPCTTPDPDPDPTPMPTTPDTSVDRTKLKGKGKQKQKGNSQKIVLNVKAGEDADVKLTAKIKVGKKTYKIKESTSVDSSGNTKVKLKTKGKDGKKIAKALKKGKNVKAKVKAKFTDDAGNTAVEKTTIKLK